MDQELNLVDLHTWFSLIWKRYYYEYICYLVCNCTVLTTGITLGV